MTRGPVVIQIWGLANGEPCDADGLYLASYSPNGNNGRGDLVLTDNPARAMLFPSATEAWELWRRRADPPHSLRADGQPNRPMTAFSIVIEQAENIHA